MNVVDERFLAHRLRSTSVAGTTGGLVAAGLFAYRYFVDRVWSWDLLAVVVTIIVVKYAVFFWSAWKD